MLLTWPHEKRNPLEIYQPYGTPFVCGFLKFAACMDFVFAISCTQYVADFTYNGIDTEIYLSSMAVGEKNNNYTLFVRKDNKVSGFGRTLYLPVYNTNFHG